MAGELLAMAATTTTAAERCARLWSIDLAQLRQIVPEATHDEHGPREPWPISEYDTLAAYHPDTRDVHGNDRIRGRYAVYAHDLARAELKDAGHIQLLWQMLRDFTAAGGKAEADKIRAHLMDRWRWGRHEQEAARASGLPRETVAKRHVRRFDLLAHRLRGLS